MRAPTLVAERYEVLERLGAGASAEVYRVRDRTDGAERALKLLVPREGLDPGPLASALRREFRTLLGLRHRHIVRVHDFGAWRPDPESAPLPWFTMDVIAGAPIDVALGTPGDWPALARAADAILDALSALHAAGLVHGDVTAANVLVAGSPSLDPPRLWLMDLGLVAQMRRSDPGVVRGTPATLAPETLRGGEIDGRADLYSLGCVLYRLATGQDPFTAGDPWAVLRAHLQTPPTPPSHLNPEIPRGLESIILHLLAKEPADRPASADAVRASLAAFLGLPPRAVPRALPRALAPIYAGRDRETALFEEARARLAHDEGGVLIVAGPPGIGRSRTLDEMRLQARLAGHRAVLLRALLCERRPMGALDALLAALDGAPPRNASTGSPPHAALDAALAREPTVLLVDDADRLDAATAEALRHVAERVAQGDAPALVVLAITESDGVATSLADALLALGRARLVRLRALDHAAVARIAGSMLGRAPLDTTWANALVERSLGIPARLVEIVHDLVARGVHPDDTSDPAAALASIEIGSARAQHVLDDVWRELDEGGRRALGALALHEGEPLPWDDLASLTRTELEGALDPALDARLAVRLSAAEGTIALALVNPAWAPLVAARLDDDARRALHGALAERLLAHPGAEAERARHLAAVGDHALAAGLLAAAAARALDDALPEEALRLAERGLRSARESAPSAEISLRRTRALALWRAGRSTEAESEMEAAIARARAGGDARAVAETLRVAGTIDAQRGLSARATALLDEALSLFDELAETAQGARVLLELGRVLAREGRIEDAAARLESARSQAQRARDEGVEAEALLALAELAHARGRADDALPLFAEALAIATRLGAQETLGAARRGAILAREAAGRLPAALADAESWLDDARQRGDLTGEAEARTLAGRVLARLGRRSEALAHLEEATRARRRAGQLAATAESLAESARVLLHRGQPRAARERAREALAAADAPANGRGLAPAISVLAEIEAFLGHPQEVERLLPRSDERSDASAPARAERGIRLGEALSRAGQSDRAREVLQEACFLARRAGIETIEQMGLLALTEAYLDLREDDRAMLALKRVRAAAETTPGADEVLARARLLAAEREMLVPDGDVALALDEGELAARSLADRERRDLVWRAHAVLATAARRTGDQDLARRAAGEAFRALDALLGAMPESDRPRWRERPRVRAVLELGAELGADARPAAAVAPPSSGAAADDLARRVRELERLVEINRSLNSARDPRSVLQVLLDTAIDLTGAERGFVVLEVGGRAEVEIARGVGGAELAGEEREASREAARRVMRDGTPLLAHDALTDDRLSASRSIHALRIRSLLAAPLRVRGQLAGAIVVDSRRAAAVFANGQERLLEQLADQAGIALANARQIDELQRQSEEIEGLNARLKETVEEQRIEILEKQSNLEVRFRYDCIIGASPPMQKLYRSLEKLIPTEIPVFVTGESGTGKDLVARVLHYNGPRRERRYVTVNCAALTDTLLESELFGHRKGAFTGAERDRHGLFEQADGGTLFLDEIGEMPMHLQPKLLRAIQFGEVRRVGEDTPRHVDVRIVAATNRDVQQHVAEGRFREDLMYRLDVGRVHLPPLRERLEDVGLLVDHFLEGAAKGRTKKTVEPAALRLFLRHDWPGNVRELENEVTKLATFTEGDVITEVDVLENSTFLERARARVTAGEPLDDDGIGTLEEAEIARMREALKAAGGNRTRAAQMLGIDRSTLYRKLKRLGGD